MRLTTRPGFHPGCRVAIVACPGPLRGGFESELDVLRWWSGGEGDGVCVPPPLARGVGYKTKGQFHVYVKRKKLEAGIHTDTQ